MKARIVIGFITIMPMFAYGADYLTRGIGVYPGNPQENYSPVLVNDNTYRNLALHRKAYHSSSFDYNLTAQLITDGEITTNEPITLRTYSNGTLLPRREREWAIDGGEYTRNVIMGATASLSYQWTGTYIDIDSVEIVGQIAYRPKEVKGKGFKILLETESMKSSWSAIGGVQGDSLLGIPTRWRVSADPNKQTDTDDIPVRRFSCNFSVKKGLYNLLRLNLTQPGVSYWTITEFKLYKKGRRVFRLLPSFFFSSAWMSASGGEQWVSVDLGKICSFDEIRLHWVHRAQKGFIETSTDGTKWENLKDLQPGSEKYHCIPCKGKGRYIRIKMLQPDNSGYYVLSELEVMGRGGYKAVPHADCSPKNGQLSLNGGDWKLIRKTNEKGEYVSSLNYDASQWIEATVPATVLMSYVNIGALPDPNTADNLFYISESFFNSSFFYRREFTLPEAFVGKRIYLNLNGINWKANVFLNGHLIDRVEGAFIRGREEITKFLRSGKNVLAIEIEPNAHPGAIKEKNEINTDYNGGILGADNPTFHATIGWDWISTIRGRNIGIWNDVYLSTSGDVRVCDPVIGTKLNLPDTLATLTPEVLLKNEAAYTVIGTLRGWVGDIHFQKDVEIPALSEMLVKFSPKEFLQLADQNLKLWWPNGYGTPYLYDAGFVFESNNRFSDSISFKVGIRQFGYENISQALRIYINGKRFIPLGGNWGFSENNLNYRKREYDTAIRYHKEMNFNTIRNWVGQIGDEEFYEACDRNGIVIWQDFWLANPSDGPDPLDERMFLKNAHDYILRIRNHSSIGIYCGRNEGYPPVSIDSALRLNVETLHPGLCYISSSADEGVSGHGPYYSLQAKEYFNRQTGKLHTERGMPCMMNIESLCRMLSPQALWPQNVQWGQHDYVQEGAQRGKEFNRQVELAFGPSNTIEEFSRKAQLINYNGYRAMFESDSKYRMGLLLWMSHSCWPSMTWQTYDYFFEPTAAYFGCKKACESLHVQYNSATNKVEIVNRNRTGLTTIVSAELYSLEGKLLQKESQEKYIGTDETVECMQVVLPEDTTNAFLLRLLLKTAQGNVISQNDYVLTKEAKKQPSLSYLSISALDYSYIKKSSSMASLKVQAPKNSLALLVRVNLKAKDKQQILPVIYSDNYFCLLPGESRVIDIEWNKEDARGLSPIFEVTGYISRKELTR